MKEERPLKSRQIDFLPQNVLVIYCNLAQGLSQTNLTATLKSAKQICPFWGPKKIVNNAYKIFFWRLFFEEEKKIFANFKKMLLICKVPVIFENENFAVRACAARMSSQFL